MGHEKSLTALIPALAGANIIYGMGLTDLAVTFSFIQLVIDDMIVGKIKGLMNGDIKTKVVYDPERSSGLARKSLPSRLWSPQGVRKGTFTVDQLLPSVPDMVSEARQKLQDILNYHKPEPLPPAVQRKIREIIIEEEDRKAGRHRMVQL
jgi:trimethylamine---corrinoid protein Co-methyltransferase